MTVTARPSTLKFGMVLLRTYVGLVFLSNGLSKLFGFSSFRPGPFFSGGLINSASAQRMLLHDAMTTFVPPLGVLAHWIAADAYGVFGPLLTVAELALGVGMLTGVLVRWAAIGGLVLMVPIWFMTWPTNDYLWDYPGDLIPLLILAIAPVPSRPWVAFLRRHGRVSADEDTRAAAAEDSPALSHSRRSIPKEQETQ